KPCSPPPFAANHGSADANAKAMCAKLRLVHQVVLQLPLDSLESRLRLRRKVLVRRAIEISLPQLDFYVTLARSVSRSSMPTRHQVIYYHSDQHWPMLLLRLQLRLDQAK